MSLRVALRPQHKSSTSVEVILGALPVKYGKWSLGQSCFSVFLQVFSTICRVLTVFERDLGVWELF